MHSRDSSKKLASGADEDRPRAVRTQRASRAGDGSVRSVEEFVAFLDALETVFGPDERPRPPTIGHRFLL